MAAIDIREEIKVIVDKFINILKQEMNIDKVYLFGSYAKGDYNDDSDIDIAVISNDFDGDVIEDTMKLMRLRRRVDNRIEPHPYKINEFNNNNPFTEEIIKKGLRIM